MDHLIQIPQAGRAWEPIPEPWVTLGLLAGLAPGLRLGTLVTPVTFRAPGILAKTVATLDVLTGGRAFCGIGAGWWDRGVSTVFVSLPGLAGPDDVLRLAPVTAAFR
jgi:alkanesulfonate monooxygenase SsuD/methylene tetrahydromethanopterin reductase-like flavin-dependent oxidoreductase (luciferase family)